MRIVRHYKKNNISEDEIQNGSGTGTSDELKNPHNEQKVSAINGQIAELINQRLQEKTAYQEKVKGIEAKIVQLQKQLADLGEAVDPSVIEESVRTPKFSRMIFESVTNRTDEMYVALKTSFDEIEDLSYTPEDTKLKRFAKTIIGYINRSSFQSENDKEQSFKDYVMTMLNNSHVSMTKKDTQSLINILSHTLREKAMFSWIFA